MQVAPSAWSLSCGGELAVIGPQGWLCSRVQKKESFSNHFSLVLLLCSRVQKKESFHLFFQSDQSLLFSDEFCSFFSSGAFLRNVLYPGRFARVASGQFHTLLLSGTYAGSVSFGTKEEKFLDFC